MSDFKTKMHQIRFCLGLLPQTLGEPQRSPYLYLDVRGLLLRKEREGRELGGGEGKEMDGHSYKISEYATAFIFW